MDLKADTLKVWEPKIIGIVLIFPAESSTETGTPLCRTKDAWALRKVGGLIPPKLATVTDLLGISVRERVALKGGVKQRFTVHIPSSAPSTPLSRSQ